MISVFLLILFFTFKQNYRRLFKEKEYFFRKNIHHQNEKIFIHQYFSLFLSLNFYIDKMGNNLIPANSFFNIYLMDLFYFYKLYAVHIKQIKQPHHHSGLVFFADHQVGFIEAVGGFDTLHNFDGTIQEQSQNNSNHVSSKSRRANGDGGSASSGGGSGGSFGSVFFQHSSYIKS